MASHSAAALRPVATYLPQPARSCAAKAVAAPPPAPQKDASPPPATKSSPPDRVPDPMLRVAAEVMLRLEAGDKVCTQAGVHNPEDCPCSDTVLDSDALVATRPGVADAVIAHRGTHTPWQWVLDVYAFRFPPWFDAQAEGLDAPHGRVHFGFLTYWLAVHEKLRMQVDTVLAARAAECHARGERPKILITGHSLGSGAATAGLLAQALYFEEKYGADVYAVFFGSPRGGTKKYVDALNAQSNIKAITRVKYERDAVTHLPVDWNPASNVGGDFEHVRGPWLHLRADPAATQWRTGQQWWSALAANVMYFLGAIVGRWRFDEALKNHNFNDLYYPALMAYLDRSRDE